MSVLAIRGLRVAFDTPDGRVRAVRGLDLDIEAGEAVGLVGESGCGKSISALAVMRLLPRAARIIGGTALLGEEDLLVASDARMRQVRGDRIAMVFQDPLTSLNPTMPVGRQLCEPLQHHRGTSTSLARARAIDLLGMVGIPDAARRMSDYPHQFSGGMRQRLMIAMALVCEPELLIADEPTTALDVTIQAQILDLLARLREQLGMAVLLITHDLGVVAGVTDRVVVMYAGRVAEQGPTVDVLEAPGHPYTDGLLGSVARLDRPRLEPLRPIDGMPPNLAHPMTACAFSSRCWCATARCSDQPPLQDIGGGRASACWAVADRAAARARATHPVGQG